MESQVGMVAIAIAAAIFIIGTGWYFKRYLDKSKHQRHIQQVLESLGVKYLRNIVIPDGIDGLAFIDYILLVPNGVVVLDVNYSEGHLFGGDAVDQWSQVVNNKTYKFNNPLYTNQARCQAVLWNVENMNLRNNNDNNAGDKQNNWDVHGWIVFSSAGNFPKGMPKQVSIIDNLKSDLEKQLNISEPTDEKAQEIWDKLHDLSIKTRNENLKTN